ncbi:MAG: RNA polymerase sigma factor [Clostridia bacterium]|nr:RNA polymerase sigma factor [Clostridia bacterium]
MLKHSDKKDSVLVELTLLGDTTAYAELVTRHEKAVKGSAYKITGGTYFAEDASQDAFVSAWINLSSLRDRDKFGSWVCAIAKNCASRIMNHYTATIPAISLDTVALYESGEDGGFDALSLSGNETESELQLAVDSLSEKIREAVKLHYFHGLSVNEIAEKLSLPAGTVKWRLSEGRKRLRKEFGVMEKTYNENENLVTRVMRQVEELKLWKLKDDRTGFEADYKHVLEAVEALEESDEKKHAMADVLLTGYWWLPGKQNDELLAKIKQAALESHNEDVMASVIADEAHKRDGKERIEYMRDELIPFVKENGFIKALGYLHFWLGLYLTEEGMKDEGIESYKKVLDVLEPGDVYYANALAVLEMYNRKVAYEGEAVQFGYELTGEELRYIDGKLYFWSQPGFGRGSRVCDLDSIFWYSSRVDSLILDPEMKPGDVISSSDNKCTLTFAESGATVTTPAGTFENCRVYVFDGERYGTSHVETTFCEGVGIVRQVSTRDTFTEDWRLSSYEIKGGEGMIPFAEGNIWRYDCVSAEDSVIADINNTFKCTYFDGSKVVLTHCSTQAVTAFADTWDGQIRAARKCYCDDTDGEEYLVSVDKYLTRAAELAVTKRQKVHTKIATDVMKRIFDTDPVYNPEYTEKGIWNFFDFYNVKTIDGKTAIPEHGRIYAFEWKDFCGGLDGYHLLYNFLYDILYQATGYVWSDEWVPGYTQNKKFKYSFNTNVDLSLKVLPEETVVTPAGTFENCRHVYFELDGLKGGWDYRGGKMNYWFAPGVGIVKFSSIYDNGKVEGFWTLTDYRGTGEGYFPVADGLFRRYEPVDIGSGLIGSVEYTFDEDETGTVLFRNAYGTQKREEYLKRIKG